MEMLWPTSLYLLGLIPVLVAVYILVLRRRRRYAIRFSSLTLIRPAMTKSSKWRRHLPFILFLLALAALVVAFSRPTTEVTVPARRATILLAIDVSRSMCSNDIEPNRLEAAKSAALSFVENQEASTQIGIVAFSGFAELVQEPTSDQELLSAAIERLITGRRTAIGSAILKSIDALAEFDKNILPIGGTQVPGSESKPPAKGDFVPAIIVLLTDGVSNSGPYPLDAAQEAVARGVRVYTIGFGTSNPGSLRSCEGFSFGENLGGSGFGGGFGGGFGFGGGGGGFNRGIDEATLMQISEMTGGKYYSATSSSELQDVFKGLPTYLITKTEQMEISVFFTAIGALFAAVAVILSMLWHPIS